MSKTRQDINKQAGEEHEEFHRQQAYSREQCETLADMVKNQPIAKDQDEGDFITAWQSHDTELGDKPLKPAQGHTPGPWINNGGQIESEHPSVERTLGKRIIATVGMVNKQTHQDTANARLIAAAPDLLAAARLVEAQSHENLDGSYTVDESAMDAICAAIAKAEGRA